MAWEKRGGKYYLYRKERIGKKIKSVYLGSGSDAILLQNLEEMRRNREEIEKEKSARQRAEAAKLDDEIEAIANFNNHLIDALFLIGGYHQHKRQWRKIRKIKTLK